MSVYYLNVCNWGAAPDLSVLHGPFTYRPLTATGGLSTWAPVQTHGSLRQGEFEFVGTQVHSFLVDHQIWGGGAGSNTVKFRLRDLTAGVTLAEFTSVFAGMVFSATLTSVPSVTSRIEIEYATDDIPTGWPPAYGNYFRAAAWWVRCTF